MLKVGRMACDPQQQNKDIAKLISKSYKYHILIRRIEFQVEFPKNCFRIYLCRNHKNSLKNF